MTDKQFLWDNTWKALKLAQIADKGFSKEDVRAGGRATKAYPNKEDEKWWFDNGLAMVEAWETWRDNSGWTIATMPDGKPAIELDIEVEIGGLPVKMVIDRVMQLTPEGATTNDYVVLDLKTGKTTPSSALQLGLYATGIELAYGWRPAWGTYWMAREGTISEPEHLEFYSKEFFEDLFSKFKTAREHGVFLPNFNACKMCSVLEYCKYKTQQPLEIKK
jgi:RecB family exonuclease